MAMGLRSIKSVDVRTTVATKRLVRATDNPNLVKGLGFLAAKDHFALIRRKKVQTGA